MQEMWVRSLVQEASLEKEMATHSSVLAWRIPWTEEPGGLQAMQSQEVRQDLATKCTHAHTHTHQSMSKCKGSKGKIATLNDKSFALRELPSNGRR